jgi:hypothetical protein
MKTEEPLCLNKKQLVKRLGFACDHTINDLIKRGVIPPPLPGLAVLLLAGRDRRA